MTCVQTVFLISLVVAMMLHNYFQYILKDIILLAMYMVYIDICDIYCSSQIR